MRQHKRRAGWFAAWFFALFIAQASPAQEIAFSSPAKGDAWQVGATHTIRWTSSGYEGKQLVINYNGTDVVDRLPVEDGQFAWAIPWEVATKAECTLTISIAGQSATSETFSIVANSSPSLQIRAPGRP